MSEYILESGWNKVRARVGEYSPSKHNLLLAGDIERIGRIFFNRCALLWGWRIWTHLIELSAFEEFNANNNGILFLRSNGYSAHHATTSHHFRCRIMFNPGLCSIHSLFVALYSVSSLNNFTYFFFLLISTRNFFTTFLLFYFQFVCGFGVIAGVCMCLPMSMDVDILIFYHQNKITVSKM